MQNRTGEKSRKIMAWCCAGCNRSWKRQHYYPPIKVPSGEIDKSRHPFVAITYNLYCLDCVQAILSKEIPSPRRWYRFWRWFRKPVVSVEDMYLKTYKLIRLTQESLEGIYDKLPG